MTLPVRIAPDLDSYPALRVIREPDLLPTIRVEFCACGEYVRQLAGDTITDVVRRHNATITHRAWRYTSSLGPTAVEDPRDLSAPDTVRPAEGRR